jgi:hypothetical protein
MALDIKAYFANIPKKQLYLLAGVAAAGVIAIYVWLVALPMWDQRAKLQSDLQRLEADLSQKKPLRRIFPRSRRISRPCRASWKPFWFACPRRKTFPAC